jgi:hypothetical protein
MRKKSAKTTQSFDDQMDKIVQDITREVLGEDAVKSVKESQQARRRFEKFVEKQQRLEEHWFRGKLYPKPKKGDP